MSEFALELSGVRKRFGAVRALDGLDFRVPRGSVCGLIGPNGAGKTTCFGVVGGFIRPDAGRVDVLGEGPFRVARHRGRVTLVPQDAELDGHRPVGQLLRSLAMLQGLTRGEAIRSVHEVLEQVQLRDAESSRIGQLSHGMRRRVGVAQALLGDPELVVLDEPTSGLDPHLVVHMRELFASFRGRRTLVLSSHILADLEAVCDYLVFMEAGRCTREGPLSVLTAKGTQVRVQCDGPLPPASVIGDGLHDIHVRVEQDCIVLESRAVQDVGAINAAALPRLISLGVRVLEVRSGESLEQAYMKTRPALAEP